MAHARDRKGAAPLKHLLGPALACGVLLTAAPAFAQFAGGGCSRDDLKALTDSYVTAQTTGDTTPMKFTLWVDYNENMEESTMSTGLLSKPQKIDFTRSILDTQTCSSFTEVVITDPAHPYVLGAQMQARGGQINSFDVMVTDAKNGWLFNPASTLKYSKAENWSEIPSADRDSRQTLIAAANAYLDYFDDKKVVVPWGSPCERLEGGMYTGKGGPGVSLPDDSCNVGVPSGVKLIDRQYVVDEALGAVTVLMHFGQNQVPDAHTFRIEHGKIRYVHTITACKTFNCGFKQLPAPPQPAAAH
jgi:hypothetical protein